jgi:shikimate dehydrogenase
VTPSKPPISAGTALCGVVLHPAHHTRSPAMHNAAFAALGLDAVYLAFDVAPTSLAAALAGVRALRVRQLAVSIPHKVAIMEHLDEVDETARTIGAVNTVTYIDGRLVGSNTDWVGAVRALEDKGGCNLAGARAVVLGAGGAARGVVFGLRERGAQITVLNRTEERARELVASLGASAAGCLDDLADIEHDVLINTTSVGLNEDRSPIPASVLSAHSTVMDAVYQPERTRLLSDASRRGAATLGGKWMLVYQAAEQLRIWSGRDAPVDVMADAFDRAVTS